MFARGNVVGFRILNARLSPMGMAKIIFSSHRNC